MEGKQVSIKQFVAIQFLVALAVKMFMLPALMLRIVGKDSYIAVSYTHLGEIASYVTEGETTGDYVITLTAEQAARCV